MTLNPIGQVIHLARKGKKVTQQELGDAVGIAQAAISSWERDKSRPSASQEAAIFTYLGLSDEEVLHTFREVVIDKMLGLTELEESLEASELSPVARESLKKLLAFIRGDQVSVHRRISDFKYILDTMTTEGEQSTDAGKR